ncbi:MAG: hypothetical protein AAFP70_22015, partial [Calditrichota bacterium]
VVPPVSKEVEPQIAGSLIPGRVLVTYTSSGGSPARERLKSVHSTDGGLSWSNTTALTSNNFDIFQGHLHMNEGGDSYHFTYTRSDATVRYLSRPQDLSSGWNTPADVVNDTQNASTGGALKSITSDPNTDEPYVAWADNRDGAGDFDIYVDGNFTPGIPFITIAGQTFDDDNNGQSNGNGDGQVNPGETIEWGIDLLNGLNGPAIDVEVTVQEFSPFVNGFISDTTINYGDIAVGQLDNNDVPFVFAVDPSAPDGHQIDIGLTVTASNGGPWVFANVSITVVGNGGGGCQGIVRSAVNGPANHPEGQEEEYSVFIDMRDALSPSDSLGSFTGTLLYDPSVVEYVSATLNPAFVGQINQS